MEGPNDVWRGLNGVLGGAGPNCQISRFFPCNAIDIMLKLSIVREGPNHGVSEPKRGHSHVDLPLIHL